MKKSFLLATICITVAQIVFSQITNTFPLNDSVGIGTTTPQALFEVYGQDAIINFTRVGYGPNYGGTVLGERALNSNISGDFNVAIGLDALANNLSGSSNTAVGFFSMQYNETGTGNCAFGFNSLTINRGSYNTAIGKSSLLHNYLGESNVAIGAYSLHDNEKGNNNAALGYNSMYNMEKGMNNTVCGAEAFYSSTKGNNNSALGYNTSMSGNFMNATAIGAEAIVDASNKVRIGNSSITSNGGQVSWTAFSDARIKTKVKDNVPGLEFINLLKPITYHFDVDKQNALSGVDIKEQTEGMYDIEKIQFTGFIAQEVEAAAKKINYDFSGVDKSGEIMGLRYAEFTVPLVKAVQELSAKDESIEIRDERQEMEISTLKKENAELNARIEKLEALFNTISVSEVNSKQVTLSENNSAWLGQNTPNPFTGKTSINYYVPENSINAILKITNTSGAELTSIPLDKGNGVLNIDALQLAAGNYTYSLIIDGKIIDTKKMMIAK